MELEHVADDNAEPVEVMNVTTLEVLNRSEIDIAIATAKRYPRSVIEAKRTAQTLATLDADVAATMFYVIPRGGKRIEGPSVRLAEIMGHSWKNLRYGARTVEITTTHVVAQGVCFDLENNTQAAFEVRRRITDKQGRRYNEDMITVTAQAAQSIALRNAIFRIIPFSLVKSIYDAAKQCAVGEALTMTQRRTKALEWFAKVGVTEARILTFLERKAVEEIDIDDLVTLTGIRTAIADGETTTDSVFADAQPKPEPITGSPAERIIRRVTEAHGTKEKDHDSETQAEA
jgi:hypothetical protein